jgi:hypothetical protein
MAPSAAPAQDEIALGGSGDVEGDFGGGPGMDEAPADPAEPANPIQTVGGKTFLWQNDVWVDTTFEPDTMETEKIVFLSDAYFDLLTTYPALGEYLAVGERVIVVYEGIAYEIVTE